MPKKVLSFPASSPILLPGLGVAALELATEFASEGAAETTGVAATEEFLECDAMDSATRRRVLFVANLLSRCSSQQAFVRCKQEIKEQRA